MATAPSGCSKNILMMTLTINGELITLKDETTTVEQLLHMRKVTPSGTAVAINGKICRVQNHSTTMLQDGDDVMIISAAYGG